MAANITERPQSRGREQSADKSSSQKDYVITAAADEADAWATLLGSVPGAFNGHPLKTLTLDPQAIDVYYATAKYEDSSQNNDNQPKEEGESAFRHSTTGGTAHFSHSYGTVATFVPPGLNEPDFRRAINVSKSGIEGVDVTVPKGTFQVVRLFASAALGDAFWGAIDAATGCVNMTDIRILVTNGQSRRFRQGELRFDGVEDSEKKQGLTEVVYHFSYERSVFTTNTQFVDPATGELVNTPGGDDPILIGDITVTQKAGWDYLWVYSEEKLQVSGGARFLVREPRAVMIEKVYLRHNLAAIGLPLGTP